MSKLLLFALLWMLAMPLSLRSQTEGEEGGEQPASEAVEVPTEEEAVVEVKSGYLRIMILIPGVQDPNREFGTVPPLPYPVELTLQKSREDELPLVSGAYAFFVAGYRPIPVGDYTLKLSTDRSAPIQDEQIEIVEDDFMTILIMDRNGRPRMELLSDLLVETDAQGKKTKSKKPRIRYGNFLAAGEAQIICPGLNLKSAMPNQSLQTFNPSSIGTYEMGVAGNWKGTPFQRLSEINLGTAPQQTVFVGEDLYHRPVVYIMPDAVLD